MYAVCIKYRRISMLFRCCYNIMLPPNTFIRLISFRTIFSVLAPLSWTFSMMLHPFLFPLVSFLVTLLYRFEVSGLVFTFPSSFFLFIFLFGSQASVFSINSTTILICFSLTLFSSRLFLNPVNIIVAIVAGIYQLCAGILQ